MKDTSNVFGLLRIDFDNSATVFADVSIAVRSEANEPAFTDPASANATGSALASMLIYILMALVLVFRPSGLFGEKS